jgi:homogentisate 1,2-dioxygenase
MATSTRAEQFEYQSGFGSEFASEALPGALPVGQNSPQKCPYGLYAEQMSGTPFTAPRSSNRRSWLYRIRPSVMHKPYRQISNGLVRGTPFNELVTSPNQMRWSPFAIPKEKKDFVDGLITIAGNGDASMHSGVAIHIYSCNQSMQDRFFYDADGELLIVPQLGRAVFHTEFGRIEAAPGEIVVIQRGIKFRVELLEGQAR